jgi:hypothetical protein
MAIVKRFEIDEYKVFESKPTVGYRRPVPTGTSEWPSHRPGFTQPSDPRKESLRPLAEKRQEIFFSRPN